MNTVVIRNPATGEGKPLPLALAGLPKEIEGKPVHYRRKEVARVGTFVHPATGKSFALTRQRMQQLVAAFKRRFAKGVKPFVPDKHTLSPRAGDNFGYVVSLSLDGDSLYADLQLIGDEALALAARNDVSICTLSDVIDADGERYAEALHHVALTPNPALSGLGGYVKIAASASPFADHPVFELSLSGTQTPKGASMPFTLDPELGAKLRQKLNLGADVPDEQVATVGLEHVAAAIDVQAKAQADAQKVTALSADLKRVERELAAQNEKVLALSAEQPKELDPRTFSLLRRALKTERTALVDSGVVSEAGVRKLETLLQVDRPDGVGLQLSAGSDDADAEILAAEIFKVVRDNPGIKTNHAVQRARVGSLALSADRGDDSGPLSPERKRELLNETPLGQAAVAGK